MALKRRFPIFKILIAALGLFLVYKLLILPHQVRLDMSRLISRIRNFRVETEDGSAMRETASQEGATEVGKCVKKIRSEAYFKVAKEDYYHERFDDAMLRLERAVSLDPSNYEAFRLMGQIRFEERKFRQAFNYYSRALEIPNDDPYILRDLNMLKKLLHFHEIELVELRSRNRASYDPVVAAEIKALEFNLED